mgnify:CR=1 FL=1
MPKRQVEPARQPLYTWPERDKRSVMMLQSQMPRDFAYLSVLTEEQSNTQGGISSERH